ncbi:hypothetical protein [Clostridium saccharoperbutylacetonicum]
MFEISHKEINLLDKMWMKRVVETNNENNIKSKMLDATFVNDIDEYN